MRKKSAIIAVDVRRFGHAINTDEIFGTHRPDRQRRFHGFGVDTVQALMLAMMMVRVELLTSPEGKAGALLWFGRRELGLPSDETLAGDDQNQTEQKVECSFCGSAIAEGSRHGGGPMHCDPKENPP